MIEVNEGCKKCAGCTENIFSINTPDFWAKVKIERNKLCFAFDMCLHGMRTESKIRYCPFCGRELK